MESCSLLNWGDTGNTGAMYEQLAAFCVGLHCSLSFTDIYSVGILLIFL